MENLVGGKNNDGTLLAVGKPYYKELERTIESNEW